MNEREKVIYATIRETIDEEWIDIECRFSNDEKYVAIQVDALKPWLANTILALLQPSGEPITRESALDLLFDEHFEIPGRCKTPAHLGDHCPCGDYSDEENWEYLLKLAREPKCPHEECPHDSPGEPVAWEVVSKWKPDQNKPAHDTRNAYLEPSQVQGWFAKNFLSAPALAAFQEVMALAFTAYREAEATALHAAIREHGLRDQGVPPEPTQGGDGE